MLAETVVQDLRFAVCLVVFVVRLCRCFDWPAVVVGGVVVVAAIVGDHWAESELGTIFHGTLAIVGTHFKVPTSIRN